MQMIRVSHRLTVVMLAASIAFSAIGCSSNATRTTGESPDEIAEEASMRDEGYWFSHAVPMLTTIAQDTAWSAVRRDDTDTIVLKERRQRPDGSVGRLTWLISFSSPPALASPVLVDGKQAHGWVLEEGDGQRTYAAPLAGEVTIHERAAERLVATLNVVMSPKARQAVREDDEPWMGLQANVDLPRRRVHIPTEDMRIRTYQSEP